MAETYLIRFQVKPQQRERFLDLLTKVLENMQHEETFIAASLSESDSTPNSFTLLETWQDRQDVLDVQLKRSYRDAWHAALPDLLQAERQIDVLRPVWGAGTGD